MNIQQLYPFKKELVSVIIETPKGSQNKFVYDPELDLFRLKKTLPMGTTFPFDFGFIPNTIGEDGDPLDVLVIMDEPSYPGCLVECRILGTLKAKQTEKKEKRNDRIIAIADSSILYKDVKDLKSLNKSMTDEISNFFIDYNKHEGKKFKIIGWEDTKEAVRAIEKAITII